MIEREAGPRECELIDLMVSATTPMDVEEYAAFWDAYRCARAEIIATAAEPWTPVSERLPEDSSEVIVCHGAFTPAVVRTGYYGGEPLDWRDDFDNEEGVELLGITHWQPLPPPVQEESK